MPESSASLLRCRRSVGGWGGLLSRLLLDLTVSELMMLCAQVLECRCCTRSFEVIFIQIHLDLVGAAETVCVFDRVSGQPSIRYRELEVTNGVAMEVRARVA